MWQPNYQPRKCLFTTTFVHFSRPENFHKKWPGFDSQKLPLKYQRMKTNSCLIIFQGVLSTFSSQLKGLWKQNERKKKLKRRFHLIKNCSKELSFLSFFHFYLCESNADLYGMCESHVENWYVFRSYKSVKRISVLSEKGGFWYASVNWRGCKN